MMILSIFIEFYFTKFKIFSYYEYLQRLQLLVSLIALLMVEIHHYSLRYLSFYDMVLPKKGPFLWPSRRLLLGLA